MHRALVPSLLRLRMVLLRLLRATQDILRKVRATPVILNDSERPVFPIQSKQSRSFERFTKGTFAAVRTIRSRTNRVRVVVSLLTTPKPAEELEGLVHGCTKLPSESDVPVYKRPLFWGAGAGIVFAILQWIFW